MAVVVKNLPANAEGVRDVGLIPGLGRYPGGGNGKPLKYSCLQNPMDRGAWQATAHAVAKSRTRLSDCHCHCQCHLRIHPISSSSEPSNHSVKYFLHPWSVFGSD